jgi:hypothetical protein
VTDRLEHPAGSGYAPEYDLSPWEKGAAGEKLTADWLNGSIEVKHDLRARDRIFFECECQWKDGGWHPSGVFSTAADTWVHVLPGFYLVLQVARLRTVLMPILNEGRPAGGGLGILEKPAGREGEWPTRGVVVPFRDALRLFTPAA